MSPHVTAPTPEPTSKMPQHRAWWKEASVYQIYPASFADSNDDGIGDLGGIISKVPYLKKLGVNVVWLSPIMQSPQVDMGYDVSDYRSIDKQYGTLDDVDKLAKELHSRGMKLVMDLVVNHTSDQHEWFKQSRSSRTSPYRDWYIWRPARYDADGKRRPPNNWVSDFQGSAWEWDEQTQEYYLHIFCKEQPDLNWENPKVRAAVHDIIRFWLDRGVDGFRADVINYISKVPGLPDADVRRSASEWQHGADHYAAGPRLHEYLKEIGSILKEYNAFSVGEMPFVTDAKEVIKSVRYDRGELNMIFQFDIVDIDHGVEGKFTPGTWNLKDLRAIVERWQKFMYANGGWNALFLENHDQPRSISRFASNSPKHRVASAKMLATFLGCQAGTPFIYQGQELGMGNVPKTWGMEEYKDVDCVNHWNVLNASTTDPAKLAEARAEYQKKSRDNARTPVQWSNATNAGFTSPNTKPWMSIVPDFETINAEAQVDDPKSTFSYWASVLQARKDHKDILVYGDFNMVDETNNKVLAYTRRAETGQTLLVLCNFDAEPCRWDLQGFDVQKVVLSTMDRTIDELKGSTIILQTYEAVALLVSQRTHP